jgi:flagellar assembly protein FliH
MSNSSKHSGFRNIPAPQGSKASSSYNRFIPREELGDFASWKPGSLGDSGSAGPGGLKGASTPSPQAAPAEPSTDEWRSRIQSARQSGYQDGYRDGLAALEGFKQSFAQQATQQIGTLLEAFDQQLDKLDGEVAAAVSATAVALARQVLRAELQTRPELVAEVAAQAVSAVMLSARHITVQVHPLDLPMVAEGAEEALAARGARLLPDASLARGGVLVQSDIGAVDARIAGRWAQATAALGSDLPWEDQDT